MRIAPGGPFDGERRLPPEIEANVKAAYNLDKPVYEQYFIYLGHLSHGDFGPSFKTKDFTVGEMIASGLPVSIKLGLSAITLAVFFGTLLGIFAAIRQNTLADYSVMSLAMVGITIPTFVTAPLLTLLFGVYGLHIFGIDITLPVGGWNGGALRNMVLPVFVLVVLGVAFLVSFPWQMLSLMSAGYLACIPLSRKAWVKRKDEEANRPPPVLLPGVVGAESVKR